MKIKSILAAACIAAISSTGASATTKKNSAIGEEIRKNIICLYNFEATERLARLDGDLETAQIYDKSASELFNRLEVMAKTYPNWTGIIYKMHHDYNIWTGNPTAFRNSFNASRVTWCGQYFNQYFNRK